MHSFYTSLVASTTLWSLPEGLFNYTIVFKLSPLPYLRHLWTHTHHPKKTVSLVVHVCVCEQVVRVLCTYLRTYLSPFVYSSRFISPALSVQYISKHSCPFSS